MANEYVSIADVRLQVGNTNDADDTLLAVALEAASRAIDGYCGRRFYVDEEATARTFRADDPVELNVQDFFDVDSLVVETDDNADGIFETTWDSTSYQLEPLNAAALGRPYRQLVAIDVRIWPTGVWLAGSPFEMASYPTRARRACVRITTKWGWETIPALVVEATLIQCARVFKRRVSPFGVAGSAELGQIRMLASRLDPDVQVLLDEGGLRLGGARTGPQSIRTR